MVLFASTNLGLPMGKRGWAITPADRSGRGAVDAATEEEVATEWRSRFARLGVLRMEQWGSNHFS